jgi:hypothetical protein
VDLVQQQVLLEDSKLKIARMGGFFMSFLLTFFLS